ncbi:MAG TPA: efflux RND transporter permease subunit [Bryobacteraceae bacterium]|nr:efflux RND transporter permease subunit [Bryobacteraceae bacterium]
MSLSSPFIQRPVATTLLLIAVTMAGGIAYFQLPVSPLPQIDYPTINVSASLPGGSPEVMAASVATPLEKQFTRIAGITEMTSRSTLGSANITLQFDLNREINSAARDVQAAINASLGYLPSNLPQRPRYRKINPADAPILVLSLQSDIVPREKLYDLASSVFAQKLAQVRGVGQVGVNGSSLPAVRVELNPQPVSRYNVGMDVVGNFLASANANRPKGAIETGQSFIPLQVTDQLNSAKDYKDLVVIYRGKAPIRLSDLGRVIDATEDVRNIGMSNGRPAVSININRQPNANIIETVDKIKKLLPQFRAALPPSTNMLIDTDRTLTIRSSVLDAERNMLISISLVVFVVLFFLRNLWATFIPSVSVPVSLIATFSVMYLMGYSLDNLSLMALAIATGFVVDDAIVVIENISRHIEDGMTPMAAALRGAEEIGFTVLSMSISLIAVFIPILMMGGIVGRLFREFAMVLSIAICISMVVSLTATPMMCSRLLKSHGNHGKFYQWSEKMFDWVLSTYASALEAVLDHTALTMVVMALTIGVNVYLYVKVPKGFFPQQDTGRLQGGVQGQQHISYQAMVEKAKWFEQQIRRDPAVDRVNMTMGAGSGGPGGGGVTSAQINIQLKPLSERKVSTDDVINRIRRTTGGMPGAQLFLQNSQDIRIGGRQSNSQYQYTLQCADLSLLGEWGPKLLARLSRQPEVTDLFSDQQISGLSSNVTIDRDTAARLGLTAQAVDVALYSAFGQRQVSTMYKSINQYHVVLALQQQWWQAPDYLEKIYVQTPRGVSVPLSSFAHFSEGITPLQLPHQGQFPATTISFNLAEGYTLEDAVRAITRAEIEMSMPQTITGSFAGTAKQFQDSMATMPYLIGAALLVVYIILGMLYESLIHPLTIISTLPSAGVGALMALVLFRTELTIIALIGIFLLIGIVKKNAIMMIDFALAAERQEGMSPRDAIFRACLLRFRPITMTTMAALLGGVPLAAGLGDGAELRKPLGISIVGGLLVSQLLTLFTTPVIYLYLDRLSVRFSRKHSDKLPGFLIPGGAVESAD